MNKYRRFSAANGTVLAAFLAFGAGYLRAGAATPALTVEQEEAFLRTAKIVKATGAKKGVTDTLRLTLSDGKMTHDASLQRIHETKSTFQGQSGSTEFNFKDWWEFDVVGWKLARMLGIDDMVPPTVDRKYQGQNAAFTWWIEDVAMDEADRVSKKINPPDPDAWAKEMNVARVFDQLIYNTDRNATNFLYDKQWRLWMIDVTRGFRMQKTLLDPKALSVCDRNLLAKMKALNQATLLTEFKTYLNKQEVQGLLARRDLIVKFFEAKGEAGLYDRPKR